MFWSYSHNHEGVEQRSIFWLYARDPGFLGNPNRGAQDLGKAQHLHNRSAQKQMYTPKKKKSTGQTTYNISRGSLHENKNPTFSNVF